MTRGSRASLVNRRSTVGMLRTGSARGGGGNAGTRHPRRISPTVARPGPSVIRKSVDRRRYKGLRRHSCVTMTTVLRALQSSSRGSCQRFEPRSTSRAIENGSSRRRTGGSTGTGGPARGTTHCWVDQSERGSPGCWFGRNSATQTRSRYVSAAALRGFFLPFLGVPPAFIGEGPRFWRAVATGREGSWRLKKTDRPVTHPA